MRSRGASLVEMLVVMAIIIVMMGISVPVFMKARANAIGGGCLSNLRQVHKAIQLYNADHGGSGNLPVVYPAHLWDLTGNAKITLCKRSHSPFFPAWGVQGWFEYAKKTSNPVLAIDTSTNSHSENAIGLFADGNVVIRKRDQYPTNLDFWK